MRHEVTDYARAFLAGLAAQGVTGCGKHFPGLGGASGDTHFVTPEIGRTWQQIWNEDLVPYRELHAAMPMIMMNHAAYPATPGKNRPASASDFWITTVLRKRIGYRGIILSDDLEMGGILKFLPVDEAAIAAVRAGSDLLEICHSAELILRSYEALIAEAERSAAFRTLLLGGPARLRASGSGFMPAESRARSRPSNSMRCASGCFDSASGLRPAKQTRSLPGPRRRRRSHEHARNDRGRSDERHLGRWRSMWPSCALRRARARPHAEADSRAGELSVPAALRAPCWRR